MRVYRTGLRTRFRGITVRDGVLLRLGDRWAEFSPFPEYDDAYALRWLYAAVSALAEPLPCPVRDSIPVNVTVPAVDAEQAYAIVQASGGCQTAKVKVAEGGQSLADDQARLEAVRAALGGGGAIRVDANTAWSVDEAEKILPILDRAAAGGRGRGGLQYAEQPVGSVDDMAALRRRIDVPIAADESIRRSSDPHAVVRLDAADYAVVKAQPLGGVRAALNLIEDLALPTVISSALESSVGIAAGVHLAACVPSELTRDADKRPLACGLATVHLFDDDVTSTPLLPEQGELPVRAITPDRLLAGDAQVCADAETERWWRQRLERVACLAGDREAASPYPGLTINAEHVADVIQAQVRDE